MTSRGCAETEAAAKAMDRAPPSGIKHRHRGLVDEELGRAQSAKPRSGLLDNLPRLQVLLSNGDLILATAS
jgi:hypothetical protein